MRLIHLLMECYQKSGGCKVSVRMMWRQKHQVHKTGAKACIRGGQNGRNRLPVPLCGRGTWGIWLQPPPRMV